MATHLPDAPRVQTRQNPAFDGKLYEHSNARQPVVWERAVQPGILNAV